MNGILYTSNNCFYLQTNSGVNEYTSEKIVNYCNNIESIRRRNEWKTSGAGARFMDSYVPENSDDSAKRDTSINGVSCCGDEVIYSAKLGVVCGIYKKVLEKNTAEGLIMSSRDIQIYKLSARGGSCAASVGNKSERHIAIFNTATGSYRELTEGEVIEDYPSYSQDGGKIFYSSAGIAFSAEGIAVGVGTYGIFCYYINSNKMEELLASDKYDYIAPKEDSDGNLLFIKRPYRSTGKKGNIFIDLLLFPVRIIKAIGGLLNYFSIIFGGESLRSGQSAKDIKTKQRSEKDLFFDDNVINAQQILKENQRRGEKFPGIIPHSWELIRSDENGNQRCLKKGVMDYVLCKNGDIVYSNGNAIVRLSADGSEQLLEKCRMANNLTEI